MSYCGFIIKIKNLRPAENSDNLNLCDVFESTVVVGKEFKEDDVAVYFPSDGQLSKEFCEINNLLRKKDPETGKNVGGYMDPEKRNVRAINLRGNRSDGLVLPLSSLMNFCTISDLKVGDQITCLNGVEICKKYIPRTTIGITNIYQSSKVKKLKKTVCPLFTEHVETEQLAYNLDKFHCGDLIQLTLKCHGTSQRTGYLPIIREKPQNLIQKFFHRPVKTYTEYGYITGTRRIVLDDNRKDGGFYASDDWRHAMANKFENKLPKNMEVFYEVVGFQGPNGAPIMGQVANSKIKDPEFSKKYGNTTTFSYGCDSTGTYESEKPCCEIYVYRITMTNEDGEAIELSPDQIHTYCDKWGVNYVPEFERFIIPNDVNPGEYVVKKVEQYYDGPDPIGLTHVREGVVVRICNRSNFAVYKHKNFSFRVLEGIIKDEATVPDIEEAQEAIIDDNT